MGKVFLRGRMLWDGDIFSCLIRHIYRYYRESQINLSFILWKDACKLKERKSKSQMYQEVIRYHQTVP